MEVICNGYETCSLRLFCPHSKPHEQIINSELEFGECVFDDPDSIYKECRCTNKILRKQKLEKLKKL